MRHPLSIPAFAILTAAMSLNAMGQDAAGAQGKLDRLENEIKNFMPEYVRVQRSHRNLKQELARKTARLESLRDQARSLDLPAEFDSSQVRPTGTGVITKSFIEKTSPYIVVIEGDKGSGTGFLCVVDGVVWVYTAAHVLSGNSKLAVRDSQGNRYSKFDHMESAEGVDLVRLRPTNQNFKGLEIIADTDAPKVGDKIVAVGNSLGAGSLSLEAGVVKNIDETMWEVSTDIIPGNSGGPILDLKSGKVIGIVTHLIMRREKRTSGFAPKVNVKRYAARLDREWEWKRMPVTRFVKEWQYIEKMEQDSKIGWATTYAVIYKLENPGNVITRDRLNDREAFRHAVQVMKEQAKHFSSQRTMEWLEKFEGDYHSKDSINKARTVIANNINGIRLNGKEPKPEHFSWYHRESYKDAIGWRKEVFDRGKENSE